MAKFMAKSGGGRKDKSKTGKAVKDNTHCPAAHVQPGNGDGRGKGARRKLILV
jgi:hypothetical protein